ncbi:MAG: theronine dehydrogenase, partial [Myxococcaceae bacterium]
MNGQSFNQWKLVSLSPLPLWAVIVMGVAIALGIGLAAWGVRREPSVLRRSVLWALRIGAGIAALFFLLEPGIRQLQVAAVKNRVAILVDRSASMSFPAESRGQSREELTADYLTSISPSLEKLKDRFNLELYGFDPELAPTSPNALKSEPPRGGRTDLMSAIRALKAGEQGGASKKLSGILLFSDGADNSELQGGINGRAKTALEELEVPVSTFLVGASALKDLSVENVKVDDFAFVRNSITVEVEIRGRGFSGAEVPVVLSREGTAVATKTVRLQSSDDVQTVSFTFTPDQTGRFVYTVTVPTFPDEVVAENNSRAFVLKVIRDRIR